MVSAHETFLCPNRVDIQYFLFEPNVQSVFGNYDFNFIMKFV